MGGLFHIEDYNPSLEKVRERMPEGQELETETTKEHCSLACSEAYVQLLFLFILDQAHPSVDHNAHSGLGSTPSICSQENAS